MIKEANQRINDFIDILYIDAISKVVCKNSPESKKLTKKNIEDYIKKRGYVFNNVGKDPVWTKGFTVVRVTDNAFEIWTDVNNSKKSIIDNSFLTSIPMFLNYFERI